MSNRVGGRQSRRSRRGGKSRTQQGDNFGNLLLKKNVSAQTRKPSWNKTNTCVRLFPGLDPDALAAGERKFDYFRVGDRPDDFGDWYVCVPVASSVGVGDRSKTWILYDPRDEEYNVEENPLWVLHNAIRSAVKSKTDESGWAGCLQGEDGRGAELTAPKDMFLWQGIVLEHKSQTQSPPLGLADDDRLMVIYSSSTGGDALLAEVNKKKEGMEQFDPEDFNAPYEYGDVTDIVNGSYANFFQLGGDPRDKQRAAGSSLGAQTAKRQGFRQQGGTFEAKGFGCFFSSQYPFDAAEGQGTSADLTGKEDMILNRIKPWFDVYDDNDKLVEEGILNIMSDDEQALLLAQSFPPSMILRGFADHPDWIPDFVHEKARNAVSAKSAGVPSGQAQGGGSLGGGSLGGMPTTQEPPAEPPGNQPATLGGTAAPSGQGPAEGDWSEADAAAEGPETDGAVPGGEIPDEGGEELPFESGQAAEAAQDPPARKGQRASDVSGALDRARSLRRRSN